MLKKSKSDVQYNLSHILGLITTATNEFPNVALEKFDKGMKEPIKLIRIDEQIGACHCLGFILSRYIARHGTNENGQEAAIRAHTMSLLYVLRHSDVMELRLAACKAIMEIGRYAPLLVDDPTGSGDAVKLLCDLMYSTKEKEAKVSIATFDRCITY